MSEFRTYLDHICKGLDGALGATIMGLDGIPVETVEHTGDGDDLDVSSLLIEYSALLLQVKRSAQMFSAGELEELSVSSENLTAVLRPLTDEYFVALAMRKESNLGKGRYLLRIHGPAIAESLS